MKKIIAIGSPLVDVLLNVSDDFIDAIDGQKGGMEMVDAEVIDFLLEKSGRIQDKIIATGGSAANTILGLMKLGYKGVSFLGKLNDDKNGRYFVDTFNTLGQHRFKYCPDVATGSCLSLITPDSQRTMRSYLGASLSLNEADITLKDFEGYDHIHIEGYLFFNRSLSLHILKLANEVGCTVSLDLASFEMVKANEDVLADWLDKYVDIVFANEDEAATFVGSKDEKEALYALGNHCPVAVVKLGENGAYVFIDGEIIFQEAEKVNAVDSTGAGDLWASGFLYGYLQEKPLAETLSLAAKLGSEVVQNIGVYLNDEQWKKMEAYK